MSRTHGGHTATLLLAGHNGAAISNSPHATYGVPRKPGSSVNPSYQIISDHFVRGQPLSSPESTMALPPRPHAHAPHTFPTPASTPDHHPSSSSSAGGHGHGMTSASVSASASGPMGQDPTSGPASAPPPVPAPAFAPALLTGKGKGSALRAEVEQQLLRLSQDLYEMEVCAGDVKRGREGAVPEYM